MPLNSGKVDMPERLDLQTLVDSHYAGLYQFAFSLTHSEHEACDLTQQVFCVWASKGHQLREPSKVKTWLFTTLYREFLQKQRRQHRFPHIGMEEAQGQLPEISPESPTQIDSALAVNALQQLEITFRAPVALFYLEDYSYKEIAEVLRIPLGTVKSRLARGLVQLQQLMERGGPRLPSRQKEQHG
jgi:RNA polymerase sigma-70 factor (ECF subfamily)